MVERPIKKSERQAKPEGESTESVAKVLPTLPTRTVDRPTLNVDRPTLNVDSPTRTVDRPTLNKDKDPESDSRVSDRGRENDRGRDSDRGRDNDRGKGRGRGKGRDEEPRQMVSPALLRGPKPTKPKPTPEVEVPSEDELVPAVAEADVAEAVGVEATPEGTAASETA